MLGRLIAATRLCESQHGSVEPDFYACHLMIFCPAIPAVQVDAREVEEWKDAYMKDAPRRRLPAGRRRESPDAAPAAVANGRMLFVCRHLQRSHPLLRCGPQARREEARKSTAAVSAAEGRRDAAVAAMGELCTAVPPVFEASGCSQNKVAASLGCLVFMGGVAPCSPAAAGCHRVVVCDGLSNPCWRRPGGSLPPIWLLLVCAADGSCWMWMDVTRSGGATERATPDVIKALPTAS